MFAILPKERRYGWGVIALLLCIAKPKTVIKFVHTEHVTKTFCRAGPCTQRQYRSSNVHLYTQKVINWLLIYLSGSEKRTFWWISLKCFWFKTRRKQKGSRILKELIKVSRWLHGKPSSFTLFLSHIFNDLKVLVTDDYLRCWAVIK